MAIRFNAGGDRLSRSSFGLSGSATVCLWYLESAFQGDLSQLFIFEGTGWWQLGLDNTPDPKPLFAGSSGGEINPGVPMPNQTWYFVALTHTTGTHASVMYKAAAGDTTLTSYSGTTGGPQSADALYLASLSDNTECLNGRLAHVKFWSAALTSTELLAEFNSTGPPVRSSNLHAYYPLSTSTDLADASGNGRTLTATGTLTTEPGPPIQPPCIAYSFDETGTSALDSSGNNKNSPLTNNSAKTTPADLHVGGELALTTTYSALTYTPTVFPTDAFTVALTFRVPSGAYGAGALWQSQISGVGSGININLDSSGNLNMIVRGTAGVAIHNPLAGPLTLGTTYKLGITYDAGPDVPRMQVWLNGTRILNGAATDGNLATGMGPFCIGYNADGSTLDSPFYVDNVRFWNEALSATQVATALATPVTPAGPLATYTETGLSIPITATVTATDVGALLELEGFRFRNDNGSETTATWKVAQDTNATAPLGANLRLRTLVNATSDKGAVAYALRYKKSTDSTYLAVPTSSAGSTAFGSLGTAPITTATNTIDIAYPSTVTAGMLLICPIASRLGSTAIDAETGWTLGDTQNVATSEGSAGTEAGDAGGVRISVFYKIADGTETGSVTWANTGTATLSKTGQMLSYTKLTSGAWDIAWANGKRATSGSNPYQATMSSNLGGVASGDILLACSAFNSDTPTWSAEIITTASVTGATLGTQTEKLEILSTGGNDVKLLVSEHPITAGSSTGTPVYQATGSATTVEGATVMLRIRSTGPPLYVSASSNIAASGEATTAQLTAPSGKTTSNFTTGRMWDDENGTDTVDIVANGYTELEWCLQAQAPAVNTDIYTFRVYAGTGALDTYTITPQWTIGTAATVYDETGRSVSITGAITAVDTLHAGMPVLQEGFRWRNDDGSETTATWKVAQDTNTSLTVASATRLRVVLDTTADPPSTKYKLYYKKTSDSTWAPVPVGSGGGGPVYVATSSNITASGEATTAQLTAPVGKTTADFSVGRMWDDENGTDTVDI